MAGRRVGGLLGVAACALLFRGARASAGDFELSRAGEILAGISDAARAVRVKTTLSEIGRLDTVELSCGGRGVCPLDLISYDKASVDARVTEALKVVPGLIESGQRDAAAAEIAKIRGALRYDGSRLVPARTPLYRALDVDKKIGEALAALR